MMKTREYILQKEQRQHLILKRSNRLSKKELQADEAIFSIGNGTIGTRGHFIEGYGQNDLPYTFINGFYDTYPYRYEENSPMFPQYGQNIVNIPDASLTRIMLDDELINLTHATLVGLERTYDLRQGTTKRIAQYVTPKGVQLELTEEKIVSHFHDEVIATRVTLVSPNFEGEIQLKSYITLPPLKHTERIDPRLGHSLKQLKIESLKVAPSYGILKAQTMYSELDVYTLVTHDLPFDYQTQDEGIFATYAKAYQKNEVFQFTKYQMHIHTETEEKALAILLNRVEAKKTFDDYLALEKTYCDDYFCKSYIYLSDEELNLTLNYNMVQLNQSGGEKRYQHIPAKGLSGEGYEGHYFWDTEIYMLPFFIFTQPNRAKNILLYRYKHLNQARSEAKRLGGHRGAKIPWRTINGEESSPYYPAGSAQIHINSDIAYAIMQYYYQTNDLDFMIEYGFEMLLETALFIYDYGHFKDGQFHLDTVTGPDEYTALVNDNYYTNTMAKYHFESIYAFGMTHAKRVSNIYRKLNIEPDILESFKNAADQMTILIDDQMMIAKQDQSFMQKKVLDLKKLSKDQFPLMLNFHPLFIFKHQVLKQADALLSMVLLHEDNQTLLKNTFDYYLPKTTHDSSLSKCVYGLLAYQLGDDDLGYKYFREMCDLDLKDLRNHTRYGLHVANIGGTYLMLIRGLFGVRLSKDALHIAPVKQKEIREIETHIVYRNQSLILKVSDDTLTIIVDQEISVHIYGQKVDITDVYQTPIQS
ncbi:MAG: glycoside hydrolase family 65 protein [Acholeplasmataceae bacterium]